MPEGHTLHRLAAGHRERFGGRLVRASSPQGKFADGAALIDGRPLTAAEAHGKHLFLGFGTHGPDAAPAQWVHIHLGLYGKVGFGTGPAPAPVGQVRLRLTTPDAYADLRGPTTCALLTGGERQLVRARLGPDPLRADSDPEPAWTRISRSRSSVAALLMDQRIIAGIGNIYRAEILFRHGIDPYRAGRDLTRLEWDALWADLGVLMREGVRTGRIDTVRPEHTPEAMGRPPRSDRHGGEVYVYRRAGRACHLCGGEIRTAALVARSLYWCPRCQHGPGPAAAA
ncbi:Fpg/Nei family DNA glycosylase [Streptomyces sp. ACA25]|uniref:Fpg/Nei family DNA glycosylase n=1 Tax=Streptomyces sp. ACA25 TaxID=3022596 RepID=UPI0023076DE4|nr:DNA-formamidopyrimidine glycosylase family protein [Streptomyces sp. ACA25]MDB1086724.1 Fpg/Nei family DNA glycosylase [Streptomyces sp. ACA25]